MLDKEIVMNEKEKKPEKKKEKPKKTNSRRL
jgi:hypothetical protein